MKHQKIKQAMKETEKMSHTIGCTTSTRPVDETIGYLIKNNIQINYQGVKKHEAQNRSMV